MSNALHIRWMIRRDMAEVLSIEQASFDFAWTEQDFMRVLRQRNGIGMVVESGETIVGFMVYELHKGWLELLNFAVLPQLRRKGIGHAMVEKLKGKLSDKNRNTLTLKVRE